MVGLFSKLWGIANIATVAFLALNALDRLGWLALVIVAFYAMITIVSIRAPVFVYVGDGEIALDWEAIELAIQNHAIAEFRKGYVLFRKP